MKIGFHLPLILIILIGINQSFYSQQRDSNYVNIHSDSLKLNLGNNEEMKIRLYLVEKYNPGNCFGMPGPPPPNQRKISSELLSKIKRLVPEKSDIECEKLIQKMQRIGLEKIDAGKYYFEFKDGKCCNIIYYKGNIEIFNGAIREKLLEKTIKTVPC